MKSIMDENGKIGQLRDLQISVSNKISTTIYMLNGYNPKTQTILLFGIIYS